MDFGMLGPLRVVVGGRDVTPDQAMLRRLLAMLLCRSNTAVSVDVLTDVLWSDAAPVAARKTIQVYVHRLRKGLGEPARITYGAGGYTLAVHQQERDVDRMDDLADSAHAATAARERAALLHEALALWRGVPLAEFVDIPLIHAFSERLANQRLAVLAERIDADLDLGEHANLVGELTELVAQHPLHERFRAQLMLALYRCGRQADALAAYQDAHRCLVDELGVEPGEELRARHNAILRSDPALAGSISPPAQLPPAPPQFTGRAEELAQLDDVLSSSRAVVISAVSGAAGIGKTALAVQWAHRVRHHFPDGQLYVNLRGFATTEPLTAAEALAVLLRALGVPSDRVPANVDEASALYRSVLADRRVLVLLDNVCGLDQIRPLVPGVPTSLVIVTSRHRLSGLVALDGAHRLLINPMPAADARTMLAGVIGTERVAAEPDAVANLIKACDHLPLALRIAAANLLDEPSRRIADYVVELTRSRLRTLAVPNDPEAAVVAAFALSYRRLEPGARRLFRLLGLVPGLDPTVAVAASLEGAETSVATRSLSILSDAHLIRPQEHGRYTFHDLIRLYAQECAATDEPHASSAAALDRLYDWYLARLHSADRLVMAYRKALLDRAEPSTFDTATDALAWLDHELGNVVALVRHAASTGRHGAAHHMAYLSSGYFERHGGWTTGVELMKHAVTAARALDDADLESLARAQLAIGLARIGDVEEAVREQQRVLLLARRSGDRLREASALNNLGWMYGQTDCQERALASYESALTLYAPESERAYIASALQNIGDVHSLLGHYAEAVCQHERALAIAVADGDTDQRADSLASLGQAHGRAGHHRDAVRHYRAALALFTETGNKVAEALIQEELGHSHTALGDASGAVTAFTTAVAAYHELDDPHGAARVLTDLAEAHLRAEDPAKAREAVGQAEMLRRTAPDPAEQARLAEISHTTTSTDTVATSPASSSSAVRTARLTGST